MKAILLLFVLSLFVGFGCSEPEKEKKEDPKTGCTVNKDCKINFKCDIEKSECVATKENEITDIEMEFTEKGDSKNITMVIGAETTIRAYAILNNNIDDQDNITTDSRCVVKPSTVGTLNPDITNQQTKFIAKAVGIAEIYCKNSGVKSEILTVDVKELLVKSLTASTPTASIFLHEKIALTVLGTLDGGENVNLADKVTYHSDPEGVTFADGKISFTAAGGYSVWVTYNTAEGEIESNRFDLEVKESVVKSLHLFYEHGSFEQNVAKDLVVEEIYEGSGDHRHIIESVDGITFTVNILTDGENGEVRNPATDTDYSLDGFSLTLKTLNKFEIIAAKTYTEEKTAKINVIIEQ